MVRLRPSGLQRELRTVFTSGTVAGLTDAELLDRFLGRRDDGASFEALVARHGPMVLGVCRDLLGDEHAADDAFQATFLVLVRKAGSVSVGDSLGRWLYGVAHRVARHARSDAARRQRREGAAEAASAVLASPAVDAERADLRAALHEELAGLPASFRAPIVLCHLEGLTHEEAARQLRCLVGTVRSRLARGRERLRVRLVRRGVAPVLAVAALEGSSRAALPAALVASTASAAGQFAGGPGVGAISASVLTLTKGVLLTMTLGPLKVAATGLMAVGLISAAVTGVAAQQGKSGSKSVSSPTATARPKIPSWEETLKSARNQMDLVNRLQEYDRELTYKINLRVEQAVAQIRAGKTQDALKSLDQALAMGKEIIKDERLGAALGPPAPPSPPPADPAVARPDLPPTAPIPPASQSALPIVPALPDVPAPAPAPIPPSASPTPVLPPSRPIVADPFTSRPPRTAPVKPDQEEAATASPSSQELINEFLYARGLSFQSGQLFKQEAVPGNEVRAANVRLERAHNRILDQVDCYRDELELLQARLEKLEAEVLRAVAQHDLAAAVVNIHRRLNTRMKGAVSPEEVAKSDAELKVTDGALKAAQAEVEIVKVRIRQVERRLGPLLKFLESVKPAAGAKPRP